MAQLGVGVGSSYPNAIDSRQIFRNGSAPAPDSDTRLDSEVINDCLASIIAIETSLGAGVNGVFGSLAARLNQVFPGSGGLPGIFPFTNALAVTIPGTTHGVGQAALLWQLYDNAIPAHAVQAGAVSMQVDAGTYDVQMDFAIPFSGSLVLGAQTPLHLTPFANTTTVSVPGTVHQLGTADLLFQVYDTSGPTWLATEPGSLTIDPVSFDVLMQFGMPMTGTLVLSTGGPAYALTFSGVTTFTIPGSVHLLGTAALLFQLYDDQTPRAAMGDPDVSVNPTTFDIVVTFAVPISGRMVFGAASTLSGRDFDIRDAGIVNQSAVRMKSEQGRLELQPGSANIILLRDKNGVIQWIFDLGQLIIASNLKLGLSTVPSHLLHLGLDDAVKPGGGSWHAPSSAAIKEAVEPFAEGLETLLALDPIRFQYNGLGGMTRTAQPHIGLEAEAVQAMAPYLVRPYEARLRPEEEPTSLLALDPSPLVYLLINAVKTLHAWLLDVRERQQRLDDHVAQLATRLAALEPQPEETPQS